MSLQDDVLASATAFNTKVLELVLNINRLGAIVTGPDTGPTSTVNVGTATLKTIARILSEAIGTLDPSNAGDWSSVTAYTKGRLSRRNNKIYIAMQATTNNDPASETNGPNWFLFNDPQTAFNTITQSLTLGGLLTPSQITSDQNDYAPASFSTNTVLLLSTDAPRVLSGLAGGADGRVIVGINTGSQLLTLPAESSLSSAANRFSFSGQLSLKPKGSFGLLYRAGSINRWLKLWGLTDDDIAAVDNRVSYYFFR